MPSKMVTNPLDPYTFGARPAMSKLADVEICRLQEEVVCLRAEIERLQELLRGTGANRYWEERWRAEIAEIEQLKDLIRDLAKAHMQTRPYDDPLLEKVRRTLGLEIKRLG